MVFSDSVSKTYGVSPSIISTGWFLAIATMDCCSRAKKPASRATVPNWCAGRWVLIPNHGKTSISNQSKDTAIKYNHNHSGNHWDVTTCNEDASIFGNAVPIQPLQIGGGPLPRNAFLNSRFGVRVLAKWLDLCTRALPMLFSVRIKSYALVGWQFPTVVNGSIVLNHCRGWQWTTWAINS